MRGRKNSRCLKWRGRKRAMLRIALLATAPIIVTPGLADSPYQANSLLMPPLPLAGQVDPVSSGPKINPFCQPAPTSTMAGGKKSLASPALGYPRPTTNRLFQLPLSSIQLASGDNEPGDRSEGQETTLRLLPLNTQPHADAVNAIVAGTVRTNPLMVVAPAVDEVHEAESNQGEVKTAANTSVKEGPISFSLNDEKLVDTTTPTNEKSTTPGSMASLLRGDEQQSSPTRPVVSPPIKGSVQFGKPSKQARPVDKTASITRGPGSSRTLLVPLPSSDALPAPTAKRSSDARIVKGARPRVEVGVPSVAIERMPDATSNDLSPVSLSSTVVSAKSPVELTFESNETVSMALKRAEVRSLKFDGQIRQVQIADRSICAAVAAGPSQIQLIGTSDGVTKLAVWTASIDGQDKKDVYEIRVGAPVQTEANDPVRIAGTLTQSAKAAFPKSDVQVRFHQGQMIVQGVCPTDDSAKQVLRMIRSACLLPVVDKLSIR